MNVKKMGNKGREKEETEGKVNGTNVTESEKEKQKGRIAVKLRNISRRKEWNRKEKLIEKNGKGSEKNKEKGMRGNEKEKN